MNVVEMESSRFDYGCPRCKESHSRFKKVRKLWEEENESKHLWEDRANGNNNECKCVDCNGKKTCWLTSYNVLGCTVHYKTKEELEEENGYR